MTSYYPNQSAYKQNILKNTYFTDWNNIKFRTLQPDTYSNPNIAFVDRLSPLNLKEISKIDLHKIIRTNNITSLQSIAENLIFSELSPEDFQDENVRKIMTTFQYGLEFWTHKQNDWSAEREKLANNYYRIRNESFAIELKLKENKAKIQKNNDNKQEKRNWINTYQSIINNFCEEDSERDIMNSTSEKGEYYCHICQGKKFSQESKLESHMIKRHGGWSDEWNESVDDYKNQINALKKYIEDRLKAREDEQFKTMFIEDIEKMKIENEKKWKDMDYRLKSTLDNYKDLVRKTMDMKNSNIYTSMRPEIIQTRSNNKDEINNLVQSIAKSWRDVVDSIDSKNKDQWEKMTRDIIREVQSHSVLAPVIEDKKENKVSVNRIMISSTNSIQPQQVQQEDTKIIPQPQIEKNEITIPEQPKPMIESQIIQNHTIWIPSKETTSVHQTDIIPFAGERLPKAPIVNWNKTQGFPTKRKKFKPIVVKVDMSKTMTPFDDLNYFYAEFHNRDNPIFEEDVPQVDHYLKKIIPSKVAIDNTKIQNSLHKSLINTTKKNNYDYDAFENKNKNEWVEIINSTMKNINQLNSQNEISSLYFSTVQRTIDLKIYEDDWKVIQSTIDGVNPNPIQRKRTKRSIASEVIKEANNFDY